MLPSLELLSGLTLLLVGGFLLVKGSSGVAARFNISPVVVGLTIIAFGTSAPELFVSALAAHHNHVSLAFGNVVGSNIANLALVLGLAALLRPIEINGTIVRRELPLLLLGTGVIVVARVLYRHRKTDRPDEFCGHASELDDPPGIARIRQDSAGLQAIRRIPSRILATTRRVVRDVPGGRPWCGAKRG